jgi:hypothetical protein
MRLRLSLLAVLCVSTIGLSTAQAAIIVNDDMEGYASQANFEATWVPIGTVAPTSTEWSTEQASSPTHSAKAAGTATNGQYRNRRTFAETGTVTPAGEKLIWSFDFYDTFNPAPNNPQRNYANLQDSTAPSGTPQLISMGLNNNLLATAEGGNYYMARILGGSSNGGAVSAYFKLNDAGAPLRSEGWHNLKAELSTDGGGATDFRFYVDNILSETVLNVGTTLRSYDNITIGSGLSNGSTSAFFDNMYLEFVPANTAPTVVDAVIGGVNASIPGSVQHQFMANDTETPAGPFTWDQLTFLGYTPNYGGAGPGPANNPTLSGSGLFDWNTVGSPRGDYKWQVRGTDPGGLSDTGTIDIAVVEVPEPSTVALCGLLIGLVGLIRRHV